MKQSTKVGIFAVCVLLCLGGGYFAAKSMLDVKKDKKEEVAQPETAQQAPQSTRRAETEFTQKDVAYAIQVSDPEYNKATKKYNFTVNVSPTFPEAATFILHEMPTMEIIEEGNTTGVFSNISATANQYRVSMVVDGEIVAKAEVGECPVVKEVKQKLTNEEITQLIKQGDPNGKLRGVKYTYVNLDIESGEQAQTSVSNINQMIMMQIWSSVTCESATYDDNNNVKSVKLRINR